jgi:hypothetical protein
LSGANAELMETEVTAGLNLTALGGGELDMQITTAKRFPRSVAVFKKVAMEMATLDEETAEACFYALPRGGKTIEGPSARLAEICMSAWGNMRVEAKMVGEDDRFVTSRGPAWDLQTNVAIAYEVKRRITTSGKNGNTSKKFDDDMVGVTSNAASSIALRNAVFKAIPAAFWKPIYLACRQVAIGDIKTIANRRAALLEHFQKMGVTNDQVLALLGVKGVEDITLDNLLTMKGLATALKDGETTIEDAFSSVAPGPIKPAERKSEQAKGAPAQESSQAPEPAKVEEAKPQASSPKPDAPAVAPADTGAPVNVGTITNIEEKGEYIAITLSTGFRCSTKDADMKSAARNHQASERLIELVTTQNGDPKKFMPALTGIEPVAAE